MVGKDFKSRLAVAHELLAMAEVLVDQLCKESGGGLKDDLSKCGLKIEKARQIAKKNLKKM